MVAESFANRKLLTESIRRVLCVQSRWALSPFGDGDLLSPFISRYAERPAGCARDL